MEVKREASGMLSINWIHRLEGPVVVRPFGRKDDGDEKEGLGVLQEVALCCRKERDRGRSVDRGNEVWW